MGKCGSSAVLTTVRQRQARQCGSRVVGDQDVEPGCAAIGVLVDGGVTARAGGWLPGRGTNDPILFEGSLQGGVRATIISDLFDATGEDLDR